MINIRENNQFCHASKLLTILIIGTYIFKSLHILIYFNKVVFYTDEQSVAKNTFFVDLKLL